jgi:hypothetical protein
MQTVRIEAISGPALGLARTRQLVDGKHYHRIGELRHDSGEVLLPGIPRAIHGCERKSLEEACFAAKNPTIRLRTACRISLLKKKWLIILYTSICSRSSCHMDVDDLFRHDHVVLCFFCSGGSHFKRV